MPGAIVADAQLFADPKLSAVTVVAAIGARMPGWRLGRRSGGAPGGLGRWRQRVVTAPTRDALKQRRALDSSGQPASNTQTRATVPATVIRPGAVP